MTTKSESTPKTLKLTHPDGGTVEVTEGNESEYLSQGWEKPSDKPA